MFFFNSYFQKTDTISPQSFRHYLKINNIIKWIDKFPLLSAWQKVTPYPCDAWSSYAAAVILHLIPFTNHLLMPDKVLPLLLSDLSPIFTVTL